MLVNFEDQIFNLTMFDTNGGDVDCRDYYHLRYLSYAGTQVFLILFSVDSKKSFDNVPKWKEELFKHSEKVPIILVGTKIDLREKDQGVISTEEGEELSKQIEAELYNEVSALKGYGVQEVIQNCILTYIKYSQLQNHHNGSEGCTLL
jgi:small GTP-binding protein